MSIRNIHFFTESIEYTLKSKTIIRQWIAETIKAEGFKKIGALNFIFCSDEYLLSINQEYLKHDTYTDIVTFDTSETEDTISGDVFISIERVKENASLFKVEERNEVRRIIVHGVLHLCGYSDKGKDAKHHMTSKENHYLAKLNDNAQ